MADISLAAWDAAGRRLAPKVPAPPGALVALPARPGARVVMVAGPGVLAAGARRGLVTFTAMTGAPVVNTVNAKGLLRWDDPLHGGTVGLQEGDPSLAETSTAGLIVTTGHDPSDSHSLTAALDRRRASEPDTVVDVHPAHLSAAAAHWPPASGPGARPPIYDCIAAVVGPMYGAEPDERGAVPPPAAAAALARSLTPGGLVVAPPGPTGFWIGRTFPTTGGRLGHHPDRRPPRHGRGGRSARRSRRSSDHSGGRGRRRRRHGRSVQRGAGGWRLAPSPSRGVGCG